MPKADAEAELNARFADFSGTMAIEGQAGSYPLILQLATEIVSDRAALVGDAARRINPLAGQGLNQGFRDVAALIEIAEETLRLGGDIGGPFMLDAYSQARRFDGNGTALTLDAIDRIFSNDSMLTKPARALGMLAASKSFWRRASMERVPAACTGYEVVPGGRGVPVASGPRGPERCWRLGRGASEEGLGRLTRSSNGTLTLKDLVPSDRSASQH